jgi:cell division protein FtsQ|tara:strand:- start:222 stop:1058 length:837 start_codon:yes stop_codon:yes gene_type:complete
MTSANRRDEQGSDSMLEIAGNHLARIMLVTVLALVGYGAALLYKQIDKPLTNVMIGGDFSYLQPAELSQLLAEEVDGGFLSVDLAHLSQVLREHPWVRDVTIGREWPSMLKVEVTEEVPIARWGKKGFLNRLGEELIIENNSHLGALPVLRADTASSREMMENYQLMAELLVPTGLKIAELRRDSLGVWYVDTAPGLRMVIGRDQISEKIRRFNLVWAAGLNKYVKNIAAVDLRYPNGLAVAWRETALALQQSRTFKAIKQDRPQDSTQLNNAAPVQA